MAGNKIKLCTKTDHKKFNNILNILFMLETMELKILYEQLKLYGIEQIIKDEQQSSLRKMKQEFIQAREDYKCGKINYSTIECKACAYVLYSKFYNKYEIVKEEEKFETVGKSEVIISGNRNNKINEISKLLDNILESFIILGNIVSKINFNIFDEIMADLFYLNFIENNLITANEIENSLRYDSLSYEMIENGCFKREVLNKQFWYKLKMNQLQVLLMNNNLMTLDERLCIKDDYILSEILYKHILKNNIFTENQIRSTPSGV